MPEVIWRGKSLRRRGDFWFRSWEVGRIKGGQVVCLPGAELLEAGRAVTKWRITFEGSVGHHRRWELGEGSFTVGSEEGCEVQVEAPGVASRHLAAFFSGRLVNEGPDLVQIQENVFVPSDVRDFSRKEIAKLEPSPISLMPPGLVNTCHPEDVADLIAWLQEVWDGGMRRACSPKMRGEAERSGVTACVGVR